MAVKYGETNPTPAKPATGFKLRNWHGLAAFAVVIAISNAFSKPTEPVATETHADRVAELRQLRGDDICTSESKTCVAWTKLALGCEENMKRLDEGFVGRFDRKYCSEAETRRETATGIALSTSPGAYIF